MNSETKVKKTNEEHSLGTPQESLRNEGTALTNAVTEPTCGFEDASAPVLEKPSSSLPAILRGIALVVLLTAAGSFMFQGWNGWNSAERIVVFLCFNAALAATGLLCGFRFRDDKGARVSLGVATAIAPIAVGQCGGLLLSLVSTPLNSVPTLLRFTASTPEVALATTALTMGLLAPIALAGFSILARAEAKVLTAAYLLGNLLLLIPSRNPTVVGILALGLTAGSLTIDLYRLNGRPELRTLEGTISRIMLFIPLFILIGRNLMLYSVTSVMAGCLFAIATAFLFLVVPRVSDKRELGIFTQSVSTFTAASCWLCFANALFFEKGALFTLPDALAIPVSALPISGALFLMSMHTLASGTGYRKTAAFLAIVSTATNLTVAPGMASAFICILTSILCIGAGKVMEEKNLFFFGCAGLVVGISYHLRFAIRVYEGLGPWISLAILGIIVLILSSYIERNFASVTRQIALFRERISHWN